MTVRFQPEVSLWEGGIYLIEKVDPVLGDLSSLGGVTNLPLEQLANRTLWLKGKLAGLSLSQAWTTVNVTASGTWTCPANVTQVLVHDAVAGGGGGGADWFDSPNNYHGAGGGAGARVRDVWLSVSPGTVYTLTVGSGGVGGTYLSNATWNNQTNGGNGAATSFGALLSLGPGLGATDSGGVGGSNVPGTGGTVTIGGITYNGPSGEVPINTTPYTGLDGSRGGAHPDISYGKGGNGSKGASNGGNGGAGFIRFSYQLLTISGNT